MFFLAGITGRVGGAAARQLLADGQAVRALVRDPSRAPQGVEVRSGDLGDPATLAACLEGVEAAFLLLPPEFTPGPGFPEARHLIASYVEALRRTPPPRLVLLSSIGSEQPWGLGHITSTHLLEEALREVPFPTTWVRAGSFVENYLPAFQAAGQTGRFESLWLPTDRSFPLVAAADIGVEVARRLREEWTGRRVVELGSPLTPAELARQMGEVWGRPVVAHGVPPEEWNDYFAALGFPPAARPPFAEMVASYNSGWIHFGVEGTLSVPATLTPAQVFQSSRDSMTSAGMSKLA